MTQNEPEFFNSAAKPDSLTKSKNSLLTSYFMVLLLELPDEFPTITHAHKHLFPGAEIKKGSPNWNAAEAFFEAERDKWVVSNEKFKMEHPNEYRAKLRRRAERLTLTKPIQTKTNLRRTRKNIA